MKLSTKIRTERGKEILKTGNDYIEVDFLARISPNRPDFKMAKVCIFYEKTKDNFYIKYYDFEGQEIYKKIEI